MTTNNITIDINKLDTAQLRKLKDALGWRIDAEAAQKIYDRFCELDGFYWEGEY